MSRVLTIQTVPYRAKFHKVLLYRTVPSSKVLFEYCTVFALKHERVMYTVPSLYLLRFQHMLMFNVLNIYCTPLDQGYCTQRRRQFALPGSDLQRGSKQVIVDRDHNIIRGNYPICHHLIIVITYTVCILHSCLTNYTVSQLFDY